MTARPRWHAAGASAGPVSPVVSVVWLVAAGLWLGWPLWGSMTAPDHASQQAATPWILAALLSLLLVLVFGLWHDAGRRLDAVAPVALLVGAALGARLLLTPHIGGVEFVFLLPLLAGMVLGSPAGVLTGALAAALSAAMTGTVAAPLPGQMFAWALWGLVGGWLHRTTTPAAWLIGVAACTPLGVVTGMLLNLTGWANTSDEATGAFVAGLDALAQVEALWQYTLATSIGWDVTRGVTCAAVLAVVGLPCLRALRSTWGQPPPTTDAFPASPSLPTSAHPWPALDTQGDPDARTRHHH